MRAQSPKALLLSATFSFGGDFEFGSKFGSRKIGFGFFLVSLQSHPNNWQPQTRHPVAADSAGDEDAVVAISFDENSTGKTFADTKAGTHEKGRA